MKGEEASNRPLLPFKGIDTVAGGVAPLVRKECSYAWNALMNVACRAWAAVVMCSSGSGGDNGVLKYGLLVELRFPVQSALILDRACLFLRLCAEPRNVQKFGQR